ncbi:ribonuclease HII [Alkalicoccus halolimnae]|uniref:Ribonuclease HII n=1 Tax=Alkalicoccus halolimnae TaxID=1667239 RepID=A0A5C7FMB0_9BACI|nr:ribonuclease HII [Alkalicoccus halolimnae]TXF87524.1 ribonuclease HII [Alkalicoccus halolimnae]
MKETIETIKKLLSETWEENEQIRRWRQDERAGVRKMIERWDSEQVKLKTLQQQWTEMCEYERYMRQNGADYVAGIDEVGRGPLAGPVTAAAVILKNDSQLLGLTDSKKLTKQKREVFNRWIEKNAWIGIGEASPEEIDRINIYEASKLAMTRAVENLPVAPDALLIDAMKLPVDIQQLSLIKGDSRSVSIAAASITAKVARDQFMTELHGLYPEYGFQKHAGYGTKAHLEAVKTYGILPEHRKSFAPVKELAGEIDWE